MGSGKSKKVAAPGMDEVKFDMMTAAGVLFDVWFALFEVCWEYVMAPSMWRKIHVKAKLNNEADSIVQVPGGIKLCTFEGIMTLKLRGGTAAFQIKVGSCRGVKWEERVCKECDSGESKNVWHRLLQRSAWEHLQQPLLKALFEER